MSSRSATCVRSRLRRLFGLALGLAAVVGGCKQEVHFTKAPSFGPAPPLVTRREPTPIALAVPIDMAATARAAEEALPQSLGKIVDWTHNAACARRTQWVECAGARVDVELARNGATRLSVARGHVTVEVPLRYELTARGLGWARDIAETRKGELVATIAMEAGLDQAWQPEVKLRDEVVLSEPTLAALKSRIALAGHVAPRLRRALAPAAEALRRELAAAGIETQTEQAWTILHAPIELNRDLQVWVRTEPERVTGGGFAADGDRLVWRSVILGRMSSFTGQRPPPLIPKPLPALSREPVADLRTRLHLPVVIPADPMQQAVRQAFSPTETLKTADGPETAPIAVRVRDATLHPARGQLAVELQLDVAEPGQWLGLLGSAHFVGRPVFRRESNLLELESLSFPDQPPPRQRTAPGAAPTSERDRRVNKAMEQGPRGLRIGLEPFAGRIMRAARMDLSRLLRDVVPHANSLLGQPIGQGFTLTGRFEEASITAVLPTREGFEITFELAGALNIVPAPSAGPGIATTVRPGAEQ